MTHRGSHNPIQEDHSWLNPHLHWLDADLKETFDVSRLTKIIPGPGRVVLRMLAAGEVSQGGIILPSGNTEETSVGVVHTVDRAYTATSNDSGKIKEGPLYRRGEVVVISRYTGTWLTINRKKFVICFEEDIICTLEPEEAQDV